MGKDTTKASDHKSTNALAGIDVDPETGLSIDRYLAFGTTPKAVPNPPKPGDIVEWRVKTECIGDGRRRRTDGEMRYSAALQILSVARAGEDLPPDANENTAPMINEDGTVDEAAAGAEGEPVTIGEAMGTVVDFPDQDEDTADEDETKD